MKEAHRNRNNRRSGGDKKFVINVPQIPLQDIATHMFLDNLLRLSAEIDMPYIEVLKKARDDGFFDASDEVITEIAQSKGRG